MKLIVGLGNPGKEYENTRHNVGFMCIDKILNNLEEKKYQQKFGGLFYIENFNNEKVLFLKPQKYINLSGEVIRDFVNFYKINIDDILIICDDLDTSIGKYKLKPQGSSGGHNGLKNIELHLSTQKYKRLKIGIGNNKNIDTKDYVLGKLSNIDKEKLFPIIDNVKNIIKDFLLLDYDKVMNKYNK